VLNFRPNGPCLDTNVSLDALEDAIRQFMDPCFYPENRPVNIEDIRAAKDEGHPSAEQKIINS
jgi:hypothetical protein